MLEYIQLAATMGHNNTVLVVNREGPSCNPIPIVVMNCPCAVNILTLSFSTHPLSLNLRAEAHVGGGNTSPLIH